MLRGFVLIGLSGCVSVAPRGQGYTVNVSTSMINSTLGENFGL
jgi:hypothetical protein